MSWSPEPGSLLRRGAAAAALLLVACGPQIEPASGSRDGGTTSSSGGTTSSGGGTTSSSGGRSTSSSSGGGGSSSSGGATSSSSSGGGSSSSGGGSTSSSGGTTSSGGSSSSSGGSTSGGAARPSAGCGKTPTLTSGPRSIRSGNDNRDFILRIPDGYDKNHPYRLIFGFHWNGGTANDVDSGGSDRELWSYYGLRQQANNSTIFVAPQGIGNGWPNNGGRDLTFVDDMVKQIEEDLCVDKTQLFSVGFSYGGGMSYAIACARATVFRAVAVYSGWELSGCSDGTQPIAYLGVHGIGDGVCTIPGGRGLRDRFVRNNGCTAQNPPEPNPGSLTHTCTSYTGCSSGHPVRWCAFDGGHTPGAVDGGGDSGARTWTKGEVWRFFTQFESATAQ